MLGSSPGVTNHVQDTTACDRSGQLQHLMTQVRSRSRCKRTACGKSKHEELKSVFADHEMKDNEVEAQGDGRNIRTLCWKLARAHHKRVSEELEEAHVLSRQDRTWTSHGCGWRCTRSMVCITCEHDQEDRRMIVTVTHDEAGSAIQVDATVKSVKKQRS